MQNLKKNILLLFITFFFIKGYSQDIHFSQFFADPISYNPANVGFFNGNYRLGVNHKEQWPWAAKGKYTNYNTTSAYADFSILDNKINEIDWAGIGVNFINDQAGDGNLRSNKVAFGLAYHKGLDRYHKHFISLGFTFSYVNRAINFKELYFNNQWEERVGFVAELPNLENLATENYSYFDMGIGLQGRNVVSQSLKLTYGLSILHLNQPKETFYDQSNVLGIRYLVHVVAEYKINDKLDLQGSAYFTFQKETYETLFGALLSTELQSNSKKNSQKLLVGVFYRWNDALAPMVGYEYHRTRILMNFDVNLSKLSQASKGNGGFELSIVHVGFWNNKLPSEKKMNCYSF
jgi:type IX secretion system PorP/SprF family membrane protein